MKSMYTCEQHPYPLMYNWHIPNLCASQTGLHAHSRCWRTDILQARMLWRRIAEVEAHGRRGIAQFAARSPQCFQPASLHLVAEKRCDLGIRVVCEGACQQAQAQQRVCPTKQTVHCHPCPRAHFCIRAPRPEPTFGSGALHLFVANQNFLRPIIPRFIIQSRHSSSIAPPPGQSSRAGGRGRKEEGSKRGELPAPFRSDGSVSRLCLAARQSFGVVPPCRRHLQRRGRDCGKCPGNESPRH